MFKKYVKFLFAGLFSAIILSIYTIVDSICIGQAEGELGSAAIACGIPVWTLIYSTGLMTGIGGATLFMVSRAKGDEKKSSEYFTSSLVLSLILNIVLMIILFIFQRPLLIFFGAKDEKVLELILKYTNWLKIGLPFFFMSQVLSVFVRNDNNPIRASIAVIGGGILNSVLDFTFVFGLKMGINGAGLATFLGQVFTVIILLTHFMSKKNSLRIVKPVTLFKDIKEIVLNGVSSFILDICMGVITIVFNNQIYKYSVDDPSKYLAIYGVIINIQTLIQSLGYAVGQASQPLLSEAAGKGDEISLKKYHKYSIHSSIIIGAVLFLITELLAPTLLHIFAKISYDSDVMILGKDITRLYFVSFVFVVFNVYSIYYFNSILKKNVSFVISILRGLILPLIFMFTLPLINITMLFASLIFVEGVIMLINIYLMKFNKISLN